ncbi:MAG: HDIG domain-containing protein [Candidatus Diapherotrites archaeon]
MNKDIIPTERQCLEILKAHNVPKNIIKHSIKVKEFALDLCKMIKKRGLKVNEKLVVAAALLHDIDKAETLDSTEKIHGKVGAEKLEKMGMKSVADIVRTHLLESIIKGELKTMEQKIVFYADKRVLDDNVVSIEERYEYLKQRYGLKDDQIMKTIEDSYPKVIELEKELIEWKKS